MGIITSMKRQVCIHWAKTGIDSRGRAQYVAPVEKACRWAACATFACRDISRIEKTGTQLSQQLDKRVTVLKTTVKDNLPEIKSALIKIQERLEKNDK